MNHLEIGRERGRAAAQRAKAAGLHKDMLWNFDWNLQLFPSLGKDFDMAGALLAHDERRLNCTPDYSRFPEMRGLADEVIGEREGFLEGSGFEPLHAAFVYSFGHFIWKYVNCHHVARYDLIKPPQQCTDVFFPDGREGVTSSGNRDDILYPQYESTMVNYVPPVAGPDTEMPWLCGGVSSAVLLDEEPEDIFPYAPHAHLPRECRKNIEDIMSWMEARRDFWGAGNQIWVDDSLRAVAVEKAARRVAFRKPEVSGAVCITACSYMDPELNAFKQERLKEVASRIGLPLENCFDKIFSDGCDARYRRLINLTNTEAARPGGATLWGAFDIVADTAVPFPERICLAGEKLDPAREPNANWTLYQHALVSTGPGRRALFRALRSYTNPRPIVEETPKLLLGEGVTMQPQWQADIDAGKCVLYEKKQ